MKRARGIAAVCGLILGATAGASRAELLSMTFTDTSGQEVSRAPSPETTYINPTSPIVFSLSGGLDRKVRIELRDAQGAVVDSATSGLIGAEDRITAGGGEYYGAELSLPAPPEGRYEAAAQILASDGSVVQEDIYDLVVDVTPPDISGPVERVVRYWPEITILDEASTTALQVAGVSDANGIGEVQVVSRYLPSGEEAASLPAEYDPVTNTVTFSPGYADYFGGLLPAYRTEYEIRFVVRDNAGNVSSVSSRWKYNGTCGTLPEAVAVYNPDSGRWEPYAPGMEVRENPFRIRWRLPASNHIEQSEYGLRFGGTLAPDGYYYRETTGQIPKANYDTSMAHGATQWGCFSFATAFDVTLANGVEKAPRIDWSKGGGRARHTAQGWIDGVRIDIVKQGSIDLYEVFLEPRTYDQVVQLAHVGSLKGQCTVPAGGTSCRIPASFNPAGERGYVPWQIKAGSADGRFPLNRLSYFWQRWDLAAPYIRGVTWNLRDKRATIHVEDPHTVSDWRTYWWRPEQVTLTLSDGDGRTWEIVSTSYRNPETNHFYFDLEISGVPDGAYASSIEVQDTFGNRRTVSSDTIVLDSEAPLLTILAQGVPVGDGFMARSLGDLSVTVADSADPAPRIVSVVLAGGPAGDNVNLAWVQQPDGSYSLEYPVMFPSLAEGDYTLTIVAEDWQGNAATKQVSFTYEPRQVAILGANMGVVDIPASTHAFRRADGSNVIETEPLTLPDGSLVQGTYDVYATLRSDSEVPLIINGVRIDPGQTQAIMGAHDFSVSGGRLSIPVAAAIPGRSGRAHVLVTTAAPNAPVAQIELNVWAPNVQLDAPSWTVRQVIDPVAVTARPGPGTVCRLAKAHDPQDVPDPIADPVCVIEWTSTPDEAPAVGPDDPQQEPGIRGVAVATGQQEVAYNVWIHDIDGTRHLIGSGSRALAVQSAYGSVSYGLDKPVDEVKRKVQTVDLRLRQTEGPDCTLTMDPDTALQGAARRAEDRVCLLEWVSLPQGLEQLPYYSIPRLYGNVETTGRQEIAWRVSIFSPGGARVLLNEQTAALTAVDPPAPQITIGAGRMIAPGLYAGALGGGYITDATIQAYNADLEIEVFRGEERIARLEVPQGWGESITIKQRLRSAETRLWETVQYRVVARYASLPQVMAELTFGVVGVPPDNVAPALSVASPEAVNTAPLSVSVWMENPYTGEYDPATMGRWQVRLVRMNGLEAIPLTPYKDTDASGRAAFDLDLSGIQGENLRLGAEARLVSPVAGYERTELAKRPAFVEVLRGGPLPATVASRRIRGEAPLTVVFDLKFEDRLDQAALGQVRWQIRSAGGDWAGAPGDQRVITRLVHTFPRGVHEVRAIVVNRHTGAEYVTPVVQVTAFAVPDTTLQGPSYAFIGGEARFTVAGGDGSSPLVHEWSTDGGQTWSAGTDTLTVSRSAEERVPVWVRSRYQDAPADEPTAWKLKRALVSFVPPKPPVVRIVGPRRAEEGKEAVYRAMAMPPYRNMDVTIRGQWTLPDGSVVDGDTVAWTPAQDDPGRKAVVLSYTAWIEGFREEGAEARRDHKVLVWRYRWPEFGLRVRTSASQAPAKAVIRLSSLTAGVRLRDLEDPQIEWSIPTGMVVTDDRYPQIRAVSVAEAGEYLVQATITDARGNTATVQQVLRFDPAPPYSIELRHSASNRYNRAPMDIVVRPYISGGHERDSVESYRWFLDGQPAGEGLYGRMTLQEPGLHEVRLEITTRMGFTSSAVLMVEAKPNEPPACEIAGRDSFYGLSFTARCADTDGRVSTYNWYVDGEEQGVHGPYITLSSSQTEGGQPPEVCVVGIDDAGSSSEMACWSGP